MALRAFKQPAARLTGALALFRNCCRNVPTGAHATAPSELKAPRRPRIKTLICTQVPTVLTLFDVDMSVREARGKVKDMFRQNAHIEDPRTAAILVHKGKAERAAAFERLFLFSYVGPRHGTALAIRADRLAPRSRRLQEAMLQYKTKAQIMYLLEPRDLTEKQNSSLDADEAEFFRGS